VSFAGYEVFLPFCRFKKGTKIKAKNWTKNFQALNLKHHKDFSISAPPSGRCLYHDSDRQYEMIKSRKMAAATFGLLSHDNCENSWNKAYSAERHNHEHFWEHLSHDPCYKRTGLPVLTDLMAASAISVACPVSYAPTGTRILCTATSPLITLQL